MNYHNNKDSDKDYSYLTLDVQNQAKYRKIGTEGKSFFVPIDRWAATEQADVNGKPLKKCKPAYRAAVFLLHRCYMAYFAPTSDNLDTPIAAEYAVKFCGKGTIWKQVWELLQKLGAITCDEKMKKGKKCFVYRLTDEWAENSTWKKAVFFPNWPLVAVRGQSLPYLSIDVPQALALLERTYPMRKLEGYRRFFDQKIGDFRDRRWSDDTKKAYKEQIENFSNRYTVASTGRLYTMANGLPKELRHALRIHGERTEELDVKCCQPLLLSVLYRRESPEKAKYLALVQTGDVYAAARDAVCRGMDRNDFKNDHFIPWLFGSSVATNAFVPAIERWFEDEFTELLERIREIGNVPNAKNENARNPKLLPRYLQKLESKAIWRAIETAGIPAVSIHDGVRVRPCDLERARAVLMESFWNLFKLKPQIEISDVLKNLKSFEKQKAA